MAINFPTSLDAFTSAYAAGQAIPSSLLNNINLALNALETKVGIDSSAVTTSIDYKITHGLTFSGDTTNFTWLQMRPSTYGTAYTSTNSYALGTGAQFLFGTGFSNPPAGIASIGRGDRCYWFGYNISATGETQVQAGEPGFYWRYEDWYLNAGDGNAGASFTPTVGAFASGETTITATNKFYTGASLVGSLIYFTTSHNVYPISTWTSKDVIKVTGDAHAETGDCSLVLKSSEHHVGTMWRDGTTRRIQSVQMNDGMKQIICDWQTDKFRIYDSNHGGTVPSTILFSVDADRAASGGGPEILIGTNNLPLKGWLSTNDRVVMLNLDSSDILQVGNASTKTRVNFGASGYGFNVAPSALSTGWTTSGVASPGKTIADGSSAATTINVLAGLINELKTKGLISA